MPVLQHGDEEYGQYNAELGRHTGGPFTIKVSPLMRIEELRKVIYVSGNLIVHVHSLAIVCGSWASGCCFWECLCGVR